MAAPTFNTPKYVESNGTSIAGAQNGTISVGDLMFACVGVSGSQTAPNSVPSGWSLVVTAVTNSAGVATWVGVYYKKAVSGDTSNPSYSWGFAATKDHALCLISVTGWIGGTPSFTSGTNASLTCTNFSSSSAWSNASSGAITEANADELYIAFGVATGAPGTAITSTSAKNLAGVGAVNYSQRGSPAYGSTQCSVVCYTLAYTFQAPSSPGCQITWNWSPNENGNGTTFVVAIQTATLDPLGNETNSTPSDAQTLQGTVSQSETNAAPSDAQSLAGTLATAAETNATPSDAQSLTGTVSQAESNAAPSDAQSLASSISSAESNATPTDGQGLTGQVSQADSNATPSDGQSLGSTVSQAETNAAPSDGQSLAGSLVQAETNAIPTDAYTISDAISQAEANPTPSDSQALSSSVQQSETNATPSDGQGLTALVVQAEANASPSDAYTIQVIGSTITITSAETNANPSDSQALFGRIAQGEANAAPTDTGALEVYRSFPPADIFSLVVSGPQAVSIPQSIPPPRVAVFQEVVS